MYPKALHPTALLVPAFLALALIFRPAVVQAQAPTDPYLGMEGHIFDAGNIQLPYRLARPTGYDANKKYPLVIFLHGSGESGTDNRLQIQKNIGVPAGGSVFTLQANQAKYPTFFVAPQAPVGGRDGWRGIPGQAVLKLITDLEQQFNSIDTRRLYITGLSMGGFGTWTLIEDNPKQFACAVPMSAGGDVAKAANLVAVPIWNFHGTVDTSVNVQESRDMINAIKAAGGNPKYTEYPNGGHAIWDQAYNEPELLPWMFGQMLAAVGTDGGLLDATNVNDAGNGATGSESSVGAGGGSGGSAVSPMEAGASSGGGGVASQGAAGTSTAPSADDQSNGCSCRMAQDHTTKLSGYAFVLALGFSMRRRRRVAIEGERCS